MELFRAGSRNIWIAYRSIRQRGFASVLTMFSMSLGVMLVVAVLSIHGVISQSFRHNSHLGFNVIVGAKGGREQLTLNTVFHLSQPVENVSYDYYLEFLDRETRDREIAVSFRNFAHQSQWETDELLASTGIAGLPSAALGDELLRRAAVARDAKRIDLGRSGKYSQLTELVIPVLLGDYFGRFRVVGTTPAFFNELAADPDTNKKYEFSAGRNFQFKSEEHGYFEAVVGAAVAREMQVVVGQEISPAHGSPGGHMHARKFTVVGVLKPTGTPNDRAVFINMEGFYLMEDHAKSVDAKKPSDEQAGEPEPGMYPADDAQAEMEWKERIAKKFRVERTANPDPLPLEQREVTALLMRVPVDAAPGLQGAVNKGKEAQLVTPVSVITQMFEFIVNPIEWTLLILCVLICVVSGVSILVSIYNSMSERRQEIAVMRALGANRGTILWIILFESTLLSLGGGFLGWLMGHASCYFASPYVEQQTGVTVGFNLFSEPFAYPAKMFSDANWTEYVKVPWETVLVPGLVVGAIIVGLVPAFAAYRTDVAKSLGK